MDQRISESIAARRLSTGLLTLFAVLALLLAMGGIYGLMSFVVAQRAQELGIRMALGAHRARILALVVGHSIRCASSAPRLASRPPWG